MLAPGFEAEPDLTSSYFGGKTMAELTLPERLSRPLGRPQERAVLDAALAAAMTDPHLNNVLAQYFAGQTVSADGSRARCRSPGRCPHGSTRTPSNDS